MVEYNNPFEPDFLLKHYMLVENRTTTFTLTRYLTGYLQTGFTTTGLATPGFDITGIIWTKNQVV